MKNRQLVVFLFCGQVIFGQSVFRARVFDRNTHWPLAGTNVLFDSLRTGGITDSTGFVKIADVPNGNFKVTFSYIGYRELNRHFSFPLHNPDTVFTLEMAPEAIASKSVTVTSTRTNGVPENSPVRVEVLGHEEVLEEIAIRPGNISKLMGETSGIQVQQTSAITGNVSFRLQGLPGRYTQLLKDGFPLYGGFASGLSLLQIPPLDLQQVEVIKGSVSALYGSDAVAGIVNLITKPPEEIPQWSVILNQTQKGGQDFSSYYSGRRGTTGVTLLAKHSRQKAKDFDHDGFTDLPRLRQYTLNPKFYYTPDPNTTMMFGLSAASEIRTGGDRTAVINQPDSAHPFIEKHNSNRVTSQFKIERKFNNNNQVTFKNSFNDFTRDISRNTDSFNGRQFSGYSELSGLVHWHHHTGVGGIDFLTDRFRDLREMPTLNYRNSTVGIFLQDDWKPVLKWLVQGSLRWDQNSAFGRFILPRFSLLYKISDRLQARVGAGTGYKIPTFFTSEAEERIYQNVRSLPSETEAELSRSVNLDFTYHVVNGEFLFTLNQAFYYTIIQNSLMANADSLAAGVLVYRNANKPMVSQGIDINLKAALDELVLFVDYSFTDAQKKYDPIHPYLELTPIQKLNMTLSYEAEGSWRSGIEAFYTGHQYLPDQSKTPAFWTFGLMAEKIFKRFSVTGNVENVTDIHQSQFGPVVTGPVTAPVFRPIYAPLDGLMANVAVEIHLNI